MHGGGWVLGGLASEQAWSQHVCNNVGVVVIDICYRLAPEYKFPVAIYDCWAVVKYFIDNADNYGLDANSGSTGGLSAGGHMSAVLAMFARQEKIELKLQLLVVPSLDLRWELSLEPTRSESLKRYPSATEFAQAPWGPRDRLTWFLDSWVGKYQAHRDQVANDWIASPLLAESLEGICPAHIVTAEFDMSRDESEMYAAMLKRFRRPGDGQEHPTRGLSKSHEYIRDTSEVIKKAHGLIVGKKHVGIASDFDGMHTTVQGLEDVSKYPNLVAELIERDWTDAELIDLMGGNLMRVMDEVARSLAHTLPSAAIWEKRTDLPARWGSQCNAYYPPGVVDAQKKLFPRT